MNGSQINAKIYAGRAKAALRLGLDYYQYRPVLASNPLTVSLRTMKAAFNNGDNAYKNPNLPGDAIWFGDFDGRLTVAGDYLVRVSDGQTYFISSQQPLLPIVCVDCNRSVRLTRAAPPSASVGVVGYGGICDDPAESVDVLGTNPTSNAGVFVGWPCSILFRKGKMRNPEALPSGTSEQTGWQIMLPLSVPIQIRTGDRVVDDLGRVFVVNGAEQSDLGWRIAAVEVHQ